MKIYEGGPSQTGTNYFSNTASKSEQSVKILRRSDRANWNYRPVKQLSICTGLVGQTLKIFSLTVGIGVQKICSPTVLVGVQKMDARTKRFLGLKTAVWDAIIKQKNVHRCKSQGFFYQNRKFYFFPDAIVSPKSQEKRQAD